MSIAADLAVCLVGAGPRGLSVLERLCAHERKSPSCSALTVHVVDPAEPGAGSVWRTDQSRHLLMNTVASQITVFTDDRVTIDGPIEPGPSLYEWAKGLLGPGGGDPVAGAPGGAVPGSRVPGAHDPQDLAEARRLDPDSYPTRAFYGRYLRSCFLRITGNAPAHVTVEEHRSRAVAVADAMGDPDGPQSIRLDNGRWLHGLDAVVLAQGHVAARPTPREERTATLAAIHRLTYITPANPADVDLSRIAPGETVLLRGLGLNFFDHMTLLTAGRGGTFRREGDRLVYLPSGREPSLYATSRRGVPYHARGENQKGAYGRYHPRLLTPAYIAASRDRATGGPGLHFRTHLWPLISKEVQSVYYQALLHAQDRAAEGAELGARFLETAGAREETELLDKYGVEPEERWSWERLLTPYLGRRFADREEFRGWLLGYLARDVREARAGNVSGPLKAALDVLRDLRNEVRLAVDHGGLDGTSHRDELEGWYTPMNAFLSIGPPASRIEEMIALVEARVLVVTGPGTEVRLDPARPAFVASSHVVPGPPVVASALIEARLPEPDLRRTAEPLLNYLMATEQCAPYRIPTGSGGGYESGGLAVTERPYRLLDPRGQAHPRRFAYGVPTESVHWVTAAGIRPGVDSVTLGDSESIACALLGLAAGGRGAGGREARGAVPAARPSGAGAGTGVASSGSGVSGSGVSGNGAAGSGTSGDGTPGDRATGAGSGSGVGASAAVAGVSGADPAVLAETHTFGVIV
ncbi:FAD/NAD(P)-binding protein [Streptomyces sp. CBMA29]|uniref:FAD/NAD(P)-binding protein n=1 Tax=Streptomyces sp. CBMA29 TaxID=1896314 RepID=UPI001661E020|nr:FAD/NAD(P)-binding protein [Streptomyces sp. CBMA29]MBD0736476.1 FAD-binding protein [Streptomyces sp. CBMA29]